MSWTFVLSLAACAYGLKLLGAVIIGQREMPLVMQRCLLLIPAALLAGLIAKDTFTTGQHYAIDARAAGLAVGTTALIRLFV
jgi:branched-subunit amino acid transport protein